MDQQESNKKKAKNWLQRFLKMKRRFQDLSSASESDSEVCLRRHAYDNSEVKSHRNSIRKSLKKMHTRVKSCMFPQERTPKRPITITEACSSGFPSSQSPPPVPERPRTFQLLQLKSQYQSHLETQSESESPPSDPTPSAPPPIQRNHRIPTDEIVSLSNCYWYWGPMATAEAEERLQFKPDGTFLVRDSSSTSYLFSISFRSVGKTMHARIEYSRGRYNLCGTYTEGFSTVTELIQDAMKTSENGIYCYSRRGEHACEFPVRLTKPISRYTEVPSLKHLCKFVIRQYTNMNDIPKLPLPTVLHGYLQEKPYF